MKIIEYDHESHHKDAAGDWAMAQNLSESMFEEFQLVLPQANSSSAHGSLRTIPVCYARDLRVLGQMFEGHSVSSLHVKVTNGRYHACGVQLGANHKATPIFRFLRPLFETQQAKRKANTNGGLVKCELTSQDISAADRLNQRFRQDSHEAPAPYSMSQILRAVGNYLDTQLNTTLSCLSFGNNLVLFKYQTPNGEVNVVEKSLEYFNEYWSQIRSRRSRQTKLRPVSESLCSL
jgi:hypothetical protein